MKITTLADKYHLSAGLYESLQKEKIKELFPPQADAITAGVLEGKNLVLSIPTAAGKTMIAELCMVQRLLEGGGRCLYVVPLRALASEKHHEFTRKYAPLGISVGIATGEYDAPSSRLADYDILIATSEKVDSLLRLKTPWLAESLSVAVLDEIHYIHDEKRGPTLEIVAARLRQVNPDLQVLALSATISNAEELAGWLDAELVSSDWRPVPLREGVCLGHEITYSDFDRRSLHGESLDTLEALVMDTIAGGGQSLVFVSSRRSTRVVARQLASHVHSFCDADEKKKLAELGKAVGTVLAEPTQQCRDLAGFVSRGVAFHHAGLHPRQRKLIEDGFRGNRIKVISATPTLAAGVNLPARLVVVRDWRRYVSGRGMQPIPVFEYKQFAGRAGRPGYDTTGEAVIIAKKDREHDFLLDSFINSHTEPLRSQLGSGSALPAHVLAAVASGYAASFRELMAFLSQTFFSYQEDVEVLEFTLRDILHFLLREELIYCHDFEDESTDFSDETSLYPTAFGGTVSRLYLDPVSGITLRYGLSRLEECPSSETNLLHLACCCPDMDSLNLGKSSRGMLYEEALRRAGTLLIPVPEEGEEEKWDRYLAALRTTMLLREWIEEGTEEELCERYGVGPGDIRRFVDSAEWLLYAAWRLASLFDRSDAVTELKELRRRALYGVKKELLELVSLKGIGRVRARNLYANGYKTVALIRKATEKKLAAIPTIGPRVAASIMNQT